MHAGTNQFRYINVTDQEIRYYIDLDPDRVEYSQQEAYQNRFVDNSNTYLVI